MRAAGRSLNQRRLLATLVLAASLVLAVLGPARPVAAQQKGSEALAATVHLARAMATRRFTAATFERPLGGPDCRRTVGLSFSRGGDQPEWYDTWHAAEQIRADVALTPLSSARGRCWINRAANFLNLVWDAVTPLGGFFGRAAWSGDLVLQPDKYVDDNALAGLALAEAALGSPNPSERAALLARARATADYLIGSGLWDEAFGGGFWWNTRRSEVPEGKPTQTSGLAAQLFFQLYGLTGEPRYRDWGSRTLGWLDSKLFDSTTGLYYWNVHYADPVTRQGEERSARFFSYDQGILIEVNLQAYALDGDRRRLERAQLVARGLRPLFWDREHGGFNLVDNVPQVFTTYSSWLTPSLLALYEQDFDPTWLDQATANLDALNRALWDPLRGGYYNRHYVCRDPQAGGCTGGAPWVVATEKLLVDQAAMQYAEARLVASIQRRRTVPR